MTYEVVVIFLTPLALGLWKKTEEEFKAIHNQEFKQEVDIHEQPDGTTKGTIREMRHGFHHGVVKKKKIVLGKCPNCSKEVGKPLGTRVFRGRSGRFTTQWFSCSNCNTKFDVEYPHVSRALSLTRALRRKAIPFEVTASWLDEDEEKLEEIQIPCHWDYAHMVQTKKDIETVLKKLGVTAKEVGMSY